MPISNAQLDALARENGIDIIRSGSTLSLIGQDGSELFSASSGARVSNAIKAIKAHINPTPDVPTAGSRIPVSSWLPEHGDGSTLVERNYDREIPIERAVREPVAGTRLLAMLEDGGLLDTVLREIVGSAFASQDGDDYGWAIANTVDLHGKRRLNPEADHVLQALCDRLIGGRALTPGMYRMIGHGDCFMSLGIDRDAGGNWKIARFKWLPTFEMFRVEPEIRHDDGSVSTDLYYEQRRFLSDEDCVIDPIGIIHWRYDYRGGLYGRSLFAGEACYNYWKGLKEAEADLRSASRAIGATPLKHKFPPNYSPEAKRNYRDSIRKKRQQDGLMTDFFITMPGDVEGVFGLNNGVDNLINGIEYWRKAIATHARIPSYLLNVEQNGARDIAQQPALAFMRLINAIRQDFTEGIKQICKLELMLHGLDPDAPDNQFRIVWPRITINAFTDQNAGESDLFPDIESKEDDPIENIEEEPTDGTE